MTESDDRHRRRQPEWTSLDTAFEPEPVAPDEAKRRDSGAQPQTPRSIVELTSPIGHRLRVPPPPAEPDERTPGAQADPPIGKPPDGEG